MAQSWKFVSTQADKKIDDPVVRKMVRETAMRAFRRRQRLQRVKEYQDMQAGGSQRADMLHPLSLAQSESHEVARRGSQASQASQASESPGRAFEEDSEKLADTIPPDIWPGPAFDPFSSTVLYSHHHAPYLFSHFVYNIAPSIQPFGSHVAHNPINSVLAQHALIDPVVLGAFLFHSAVHLDWIHHRPWSPLTLYHRGESIRLLNKRLENTDESASDNVIAAVTLLGTAGNITGNVRDDLLHKSALNRMIKMRGGLQGLGWDGALAMLIYIGDLIAATVSTSNPLFSPPDIHTASPNFLEYLGSGPAVGLPSDTNLDVAAFRAEIYGLISSISKLDSIRSTSFSTFTASTAGMVNFSHNCFAVEHRLLSIRVTVGQHSPSQDPDIFIYEASRTAALMCITYLFRGMLLDGQIFTTLHKRLRIHITSLESLNENIIADNTSLQILLWAYCVGGIMSVERSWFIVRIHRCMSLLGFGSWEELKMGLMHYVWNPTMCDKFFTTLWPEVQSLLEM